MATHYGSVTLRIKAPYNLSKPGALHLNYLCISKRFDSLATPKFDRKCSLVFRYCVNIDSVSCYVTVLKNVSIESLVFKVH